MTTTVEPAGAANGTKAAGPAADDGRVDAADEALARQLAERAQAEGLSLTGPGAGDRRDYATRLRQAVARLGRGRISAHPDRGAGRQWGTARSRQPAP